MIIVNIIGSAISRFPIAIIVPRRASICISVFVSMTLYSREDRVIIPYLKIMSNECHGEKCKQPVPGHMLVGKEVTGSAAKHGL